MKPWKFILDLIIAIAVMVIFPLIYFGQKNDALKQTAVESEAKEFIDKARQRGYITSDQYTEFLHKISALGLSPDIELTQCHTAFEPEYRFRTAEEIISDDASSYTGENSYTYRNVVSYRPNVSDPITGPLNDETNESVLAKAVNTPANPNHVHNDSCYLGTKHVHTGSPSSGGGCYGKYITGQQCEARVVNYNYATVNGTGKCPSCGSGSMFMSFYMSNCFCEKGHSFVIMVARYENCSNCGYSNTVNFPIPSSCQSIMNYYELNCGKTEGHYYDGNTEVFPVCNSLISNIVSTHPVQTVGAGDPLITTVTATYLDGSTKVVVAETDFSTADITQNQPVTLTYKYTVDGKTYSKTCTITVTVIPKSRTCENGHTYNINADGSDPGCPYCKAWLASLEVIDPADKKLTLYRGETLQDYGVTLLATYLDGHTETLTSGYLDNLDITYVGNQTVTLTYKGLYTYLPVTVKRGMVQCPTCHKFYELYPDDTDPGCPYCKAKTPVFTGNIMTYKNETFDTDIINALTEKGICYFSKDDYISIKITEKEGDWGERVRKSLGLGTKTPLIFFEYGGCVKDDKSLQP